MDELVPNPDGCPRFEPNQFKKEKCKNCGRQWQEHKGVITEAQVSVYASAKTKLANDKAAKEAEAAAKAKAKAAAKKKAAQAVEDNWLMDGGAAADDGDSDDDMGFRMFTADQMASAPVENRQPVSAKPLKVKNLIDFGECDEKLDEIPGAAESHAPPPPEIRPSVMSTAGTASLSLDPGGAGSSGMGMFVPPRKSDMFPPPSSTGGQEQGSVIGDLLAMQSEIDHLRQMLRDANDCKSIEVAIVQDEVADKKKEIEDLKRLRIEDQAEISSLRQQHTVKIAELEAATSAVKSTPDSEGEASALRQQMAEKDAELERLRVDCSTLRQQTSESEAEIERLKVSSIESCQQLANLRVEEGTPLAQSPAVALPPSLGPRVAEVHALCIQVCQTLEEDTTQQLPNALDASSVCLQIDESLRQLSDAAVAAQAAAQRSREERRRLTTKLSDAELAAQTAIAQAAVAQAAAPVAPAVVPPEQSRQEVSSQVVNRQAAMALREVRLNAEQQLAWITKRIKMTRQADLAGSPLTPAS
jgi:hypothetical protein